MFLRGQIPALIAMLVLALPDELGRTGLHAHLSLGSAPSCVLCLICDLRLNIIFPHHLANAKRCACHAAGGAAVCHVACGHVQ